MSPRLNELSEHLAASKTGVLDEFWSTVASEGSPLVEFPDDDRTLPLVTFVWRGDASTERVCLIEWFSGTDFPEKAMEQLPGSDIWYRSFRMRSNIRTSYQFGPNDTMLPKREETDWDARRVSWVHDPLNPRVISDQIPISGHHGFMASSILSLPDAAPEPWLEVRAHVPAGEVQHHRLTSAALNNERDIWLYLPPGDVTPERLLIAFDGEWSVPVMRLPATLDNLRAEGRIPATAALFIGNVNRGEELPPNPNFVEMLAAEAIPWAREQTGATFAPQDVIVSGQSYGGLCAAWCGLTRPDVFGNVLSQSGSFWWKPDPRNAESPVAIGDAPAYGWLCEKVAAEGWPSRVRVWMEAGTIEAWASDLRAPSLAESNRRFRDVLTAHGADLTYREFAGGHDWACWRGSIADGLIALASGSAERR